MNHIKLANANLYKKAALMSWLERDRIACDYVKRYGTEIDVDSLKGLFDFASQLKLESILVSVGKSVVRSGSIGVVNFLTKIGIGVDAVLDPTKIDPHLDDDDMISLIEHRIEKLSQRETRKHSIYYNVTMKMFGQMLNLNLEKINQSIFKNVDESVLDKLSEVTFDTTAENINLDQLKPPDDDAHEHEDPAMNELDYTFVNRRKRSTDFNLEPIEEVQTETGQPASSEEVRSDTVVNQFSNTATPTNLEEAKLGEVNFEEEPTQPDADGNLEEPIDAGPMPVIEPSVELDSVDKLNANLDSVDVNLDSIDKLNANLNSVDRLNTDSPSIEKVNIELDSVDKLNPIDKLNIKDAEFKLNSEFDSADKLNTESEPVEDRLFESDSAEQVHSISSLNLNLNLEPEEVTPVEKNKRKRTPKTVPKNEWLLKTLNEDAPPLKLNFDDALPSSKATPLTATKGILKRPSAETRDQDVPLKKSKFVQFAKTNTEFDVFDSIKTLGKEKRTKAQQQQLNLSSLGVSTVL